MSFNLSSLIRVPSPVFSIFAPADGRGDDSEECRHEEAQADKRGRVIRFGGRAVRGDMLEASKSSEGEDGVNACTQDSDDGD